MKSFLRILSGTTVAIAALTGGVAAHAQSSGFTAYQPGSGYIGFNAGQSDFGLGNGNGAFGSDNKDTAYSIYGGSYFNNNFGLELGYTDFGRINRAGGNTKAEGISLSVVGKLPLSPSFNLLGRLGTTYGRTNVNAAAGSGVTGGSESGFGVNYGLGVEYAFTPQWSAVLQYDEHDLKYANQGRESLGVTSVGVRYRF
jgi:OmpA-OmpF porin, OOP family